MWGPQKMWKRVSIEKLHVEQWSWAKKWSTKRSLIICPIWWTCRQNTHWLSTPYVLRTISMPHIISQGFPNISVGKESTCNAGDPSSIPESGRSAGERIGYPLQYSWNSLVTQLEKNLPAMRETWVWPLGWEDPLEKGKAIHSRILAWRIPWTL